MEQRFSAAFSRLAETAALPDTPGGGCSRIGTQNEKQTLKQVHNDVVVARLGIYRVGVDGLSVDLFFVDGFVVEGLVVDGLVWGGAGLQACSVKARVEGLLAPEVHMAIPYRGQTGQGTYFITASTYLKQNLFQTERMARLFIDVLHHYRAQGKYLLHEFVIMPNHFHLLLTPVNNTTLERALQLIKGGFSFRVNKELGVRGEIWQSSFYDRRVRDAAELRRFSLYIQENPVRRGLATSAEKYPYSSANLNFILDEVPQRLKPAPLLTG